MTSLNSFRCVTFEVTFDAAEIETIMLEDSHFDI